jgi:signal transduction histidine kinase
VAAKRPEVATEAITAIADAARSSLDETRRVLAGLRADEPAELAPPPDMDAIRALVADLKSAGADITLTETDCEQHRPPAVVMSGAYRIVQESLTNAIKHGGPDANVDVHLQCGPTKLAIEVTNTVSSNPGSSKPGSSNPGPTENGNGAVSGNGSGNGLRGMAERAFVLGGTFSSQRDGDRFVVTAGLPTGAGNTTRSDP